MKLNELLDWTMGKVKAVETVTGRTIYEGNQFTLSMSELNEMSKWLVGCITIEGDSIFIGVDEIETKGEEKND